VQAKLDLKDDVQPKFFKPRPVPLALQKQVEAELQKLEDMGVVEPVKSSEWAAPMVNVLKSDWCKQFTIFVKNVL